jgi:hypothetical protein
MDPQLQRHHHRGAIRPSTVGVPRIEATFPTTGKVASIPISRPPLVSLNRVDEGRMVTGNGAADPYEMRSSGERCGARRV